ncbi:hypothetical protein B0H13DRAFT_2286872 [Mycena leptocephala]|nr:hypothetical protein B0H13DRAFT_2286872 [Mycena leptocephala]
MSGSRAESQPAYGRRRSNTAQSLLRPMPAAAPLKIGDFQVFNSWVHDLKESTTVIFNHAWWPGISIPKPVADAFKLKNNNEVVVTKVDPANYSADYVEFIFQDQYLGRSDMWRLGEHLVGQCVYIDQDVAFVGGIAAKIQTIYVGGKKVSAACITSATKTIFRSLSAKVTIFIQVCRELWEFAGDGERYNEKIVHSFLPALFAKWREANTNHTVTIVLISRVYYDASEIDYAAGPLRRDERGAWYKDFYKRDILLTHHYHRASKDGGPGAEQVRLVGRLSFAHDGPILEALNIGLNPTETHYIDRSLSLTGSATIVITPGTGYYRGFGLDLICLAKHPLHQSPSSVSAGPSLCQRGRRMGGGPRAMDPLWGGDDESTTSAANLRTFWWEPFWVSVAFWDKQMDLPFREDRFIARAKMHEIQMLGLLEHDVVSSIEPESKSNATRDAWYSPATASAQRTAEKRASQRSSRMAGRIIEESPRLIHLDLPAEKSFDGHTAAPSTSSNLSTSRLNHPSIPRGLPVHLCPRRNEARMAPPEFPLPPSSRHRGCLIRSEAHRVSHRPPPCRRLLPPVLVRVVKLRHGVDGTRKPAASKPTVAQSSSRAPVPINSPANRHSTGRAFEDDGLTPHRASFVRRSPINTPPREEPMFGKRRSVTITAPLSSSLPGTGAPSTTNPSRLNRPSLGGGNTSSTAALQARHEVALDRHPRVSPAHRRALPHCHGARGIVRRLFYDFVLDAGEMHSFMVKPPQRRGSDDALRREWALVVMRGMAAVRLAQGFQFVLRVPHKAGEAPDVHEQRIPSSRRSKVFAPADDLAPPKPAGAAEVLRSTADPVYLSMSNEIHRISYADEAIQDATDAPFAYECLIWPKLGGGYTEQSTVFTSHGLENYGWNSLDMLVAGYEHQFNESLRYWRTRFVVIPTAEPPSSNIGPSGEKLNDEETRILGIEKLAEQFTKLRWRPPEEKCAPPPALLEQLDQIHAAGPLRKKMKSEREIGDMALAAIAKAMRAEDGVPIKHNQWHRSQYPNSFTGFDFVSWLVREFRDVSSRAQGTEWGIKLEEQGLFEHCRGHHAFLDGHYFYRLKGDYAVPMTPRGWFGSRRLMGIDPRNFATPPAAPAATPRNLSPRHNKKRLILSQSMVIDIDPAKRSDQAESVILHHDIIHNPGTVFHFELQWIGTTARCIEDQLRQWNRTIERYGLKLVEAYVTQISDIRERNAFQSCYPLRLVIPPPTVPDLEKRVPLGTHTAQYFEYALLRRFNFVVDIEAAVRASLGRRVRASARRREGFLFLTNRLMGPADGHNAQKQGPPPAAEADNIRDELSKFCNDENVLRKFYDEELALLASVPEEPPPLTI